MSERARAFHAEAILVDGHNDLPWRMRQSYGYDLDAFDVSERHDEGHTDVPRLREGGVGAQFWAAYVSTDYISGGATRVALEGIDFIHRMVERYADDLQLALDAGDVRRVANAGKIASLIGVEGGHAIENSLGVLRTFYSLGARYLTLTHGSTIDWADSATDEPRSGGLSELGKAVVREMNRLGMLVDISHVSADTMRDVLKASEAPVIASHSNARAVANHARNVPDDVLEGVARNGGVVMVNFHSGFLTPAGSEIVRDMFADMRRISAEYAGDDEALTRARARWEEEHPVPRGSVSDVVDHIDHIANVAGIDHAGIGSDFDGVAVSPEGLDDVSCFPAVTEELVRRGYSRAAILKILGENILRVMEQASR